jgi:hypothetical protein
MESIGKIGCFKGTSGRIAMGFTVGFTALSLILYVVGCAGWNTGSSLQNASWATVTQTVTLSVGSGKSTSSVTSYFGLQSTYTVSNSGVTSSTGTLYSDCASLSDECSSCQTSGKAAFGLILFSLFLTVALGVLCFLRTCKDSHIYKVGGIGLSFFILLLTVAAYGTFNQSCYLSVKNLLNGADGVTVSQGPGFGSVVACSVFMFFTFVLMLVTPTATPESISLDSAPASPANMEGGGKAVVFDDD